MKYSDKQAAVCGSLFLLLAAFFSISLMVRFLDFGFAGSGFSFFFFITGHMLVSVYGVSSWLIPLFLFAAALVLFYPGWTEKRGVYLAVSVIPFYTAVAAERVCNSFSDSPADPVAFMKIAGVTLAAILLVVIEYLAAGIAYDAYAALTAQKKTAAFKKPLVPDFMPEDGDMSPEADGSEDAEVVPESEIPETEIPEDADAFAGAERESDADDAYADGAEVPDLYADNGVPEETGIDEPDFLQDTDAGYDTEPPVAEPVCLDATDRTEAPALTDADIPEEHPILVDFTPPAVDILGEERADGNSISLPKEFNIWEPEQDADKNTPEADNLETAAASEARAVAGEQPVAEACTAENISDDRIDVADFYSEEEERFLEDPFAAESDEDIDMDMDAETEDSEEADNDGEPDEFVDDAGIYSIEESDTEETETADRDAYRADTSGEKKHGGLLATAERLQELRENAVAVEPPVPYTDDEEAADDDESPDSEDVADGAESVAGMPVDTPVIPTVPPRQRGKPYAVPTDGLLTAYPDGAYWIIDEDTQKAAQQLKDTLSEFKIEAEVTGIRKGPVITMFEILPAPGVKLSKIVNLQDNIALRLAASSVRIVAPIPGKSAVGIEVPNKERAIVSFRELIDNDAPAFKKMAVPVVLGKDITGEAQIIDLTKTPHLLIAGSTGSGKSVCVNSMILSVLYKRSPQEVKLILIDPKVVELKLYNDIPHLLTPVITEPKRAFQALQYCLCEMERRYALLDGMGVRDISSYNRRIVERNIATEKLPYIVVIIDEFADLMATTGKELESTLARLAAMSRAVGIHLVLATQRPSIDVITGLIKANIPSRIAFMVASKMDSRIIIDQVGAEKLLGKGDMLYASATDPFPVRIQGTFISDNEVENVVDFVKQYGEPEYIDDEIFVDDEEDEDTTPSMFGEGEDPLYDKALEIVVQAGKASASYIQRRLKIGYNRAARLVEEMEARGLVGPQNGSKPREIIHIP